MKAFIVWLAVILSAAPLCADGLVLAKFHADWCPACKHWDAAHPGFPDLKRYAESKGMQVVVFDLTDDNTETAARKQAEKLGIIKAFEENGNATGFALIIDSTSGRVIRRLESGSANLLFFDSWFSEDAQKSFEANRRKIDAAVKP